MIKINYIQMRIWRLRCYVKGYVESHFVELQKKSTDNDNLDNVEQP